MRVRRLVAAVSSALMLGIVTSDGVLAVGEEPIDVVTCTGAAEQTYDPGLTPTTQDTHIVSTLTFDQCVDVGTDPGRPAVTSAVIHVDYTTPASCLVSPPVTATTVDIDWNGGRHSTADVTVVVTRTAGTTVVASTGTITTGLFAGHRFSDEVVYPSIDVLACLLGPGVTRVSGIAALHVTPI